MKRKKEGTIQFLTWRLLHYYKVLRIYFSLINEKVI